MIDFDSETIDGKRLYSIFTEKYPSITTILGATSDKSWYDAWVSRVGQDAANKVSARASKRGTAIHSYAEQILLGKNPTVCLADADMFKSMSKVLKRVTNILALESVLYSNKFRMAGRTDCIADFDGVTSIIDFKTATRIKEDSMIIDYKLQCTLYAICYAEMTGVKIKQFAILIFNDLGEPQIVVEPITMHLITDAINRVKEYYAKNNG